MDDLISRKAFMNHVEEEYMQWGSDYDIEQVLGDLEDFPGAQAERKIGHWAGVEHDDGSEPDITECWCSQCSKYAPLIADGSYPSYCPHCGSKMEETL